jgi:hypothetical protein
MAEQVTFGRRRPNPQEAAPAPAPAPAPAQAQPETSSADLEAFAASIRNARASDVDEFVQWRRDQLPRRTLMILVSLALLAPGIICFAVQAPWWVSMSLEVAGLAANVWLRRARRSQAAAIAEWTPEP